MTLPFHLQVLPELDGGWRVLAGPVGGHAAEGRLSAAVVREILDVVQRALDPEALPVMVLAGDDARVTAAEEQAGRALARVLEASTAVAKAVSAAAGGARVQDQLLGILVDARDDALQALPWECLATGAEDGPLEPGGLGLIARQGEGATALPDHRPLRPAMWQADPLESGVSRLAEAVVVACATAGLPEPQDPLVQRPVEGEASVVFLVSHGEAVDVELRLLGQDGTMGAGTVAHALQPWLQTAALVVVLVCEGGVLGPRRADRLAERLLAAGACAVVASDVRLAEEAGAAFAESLLRQLAERASVGRAVAAGRRAVRALALPFPDARWWRLSLTVGRAEALSWAAAGRCLPGDWRPGPDAALLLSEALTLVEAGDHGWLGVEHVALVVARRRQQDPYLHLALMKWMRPLGELLTRIQPAPAPERRVSARLERVVARLPLRFNIDQLVTAIIDDLPDSVRAYLGLPARTGRCGAETMRLTWADGGAAEALTEPSGGVINLSTQDSTPPVVDPLLLPRARPGGRWELLEVVGGPEDGRRIPLRRGELLGRYAPESSSEVVLYKDVGGTDQYLSRRHMRGDENGQVFLQRTARLYRGPDASGRQIHGLIALKAGDLLALTPLTWLAALSREDAVR